MSNLQYTIAMENVGMNTEFMGMSPETLARYNREYMRINPHDLPELRRKRRRLVKYERVYTTSKTTA